jgi:hypothetical protein
MRVRKLKMMTLEGYRRSFNILNSHTALLLQCYTYSYIYSRFYIFIRAEEWWTATPCVYIKPNALVDDDDIASTLNCVICNMIPDTLPHAYDNNDWLLFNFSSKKKLSENLYFARIKKVKWFVKLYNFVCPFHVCTLLFKHTYTHIDSLR